MLMLIDTPDPRYRSEPDQPRVPWSRRHPTARIRLPFILALICMAAAYVVSSPLMIFGLSMVSMMLFFDGILALLPTGDGLWSHRQ